MISKNKYLLIIIACLLLVIAYRYKVYIVDKNFNLTVNTICDPLIEECFNAPDELSFGQNPYKKVEIMYKFAPKCLEEHNCENFYCPQNLDSSKCKIIYCKEESKNEGEECITYK